MFALRLRLNFGVLLNRAIGAELVFQGDKNPQKAILNF